MILCTGFRSLVPAGLGKLALQRTASPVHKVCYIWTYWQPFQTHFYADIVYIVHLAYSMLTWKKKKIQNRIPTISRVINCCNKKQTEKQAYFEEYRLHVHNASMVSTFNCRNSVDMHGTCRMAQRKQMSGRPSFEAVEQARVLCVGV